MTREAETVWRSRYEAHLKSDYWKALCGDVVMRAGGWCELCHRHKIKQVHHTHYHTMGHEDLNDVLGLCGWCHQKEHKKEKVRKPWRTGIPVGRGHRKQKQRHKEQAKQARKAKRHYRQPVVMVPEAVEERIKERQTGPLFKPNAPKPMFRTNG